MFSFQSQPLSLFLPFPAPPPPAFSGVFPPTTHSEKPINNTDQDGREEWGENNSGEEEEEKEDGEEEGEEDGVQLVLGRTHQRDTSTHKGLTHTG